MDDSIFAVVPVVGFLGRWAVFAGILLTVGAVVFRYGVLGRAAIAPDAASDIARRAARLGAVGGILVVAGALARLHFQTEGMRFPDESWTGVAWKLVADSAWGDIWIAQVALALVVSLAFRFAAWPIAALFAGALSLTTSLSSHAMSDDVNRMLTMPADILHVFGASAWLGTLAMLFAAFVRRGATDDSNAAALVGRFSPIALASAATVVASGAVSSWMHLTSVRDLIATTYGLLLVAKVAAVLIVAGFGWRNWKVMTPRLGAPDGAVLLRRTIAAEVVIAIIVLAITSALVVTPPPTSHP